MVWHLGASSKVECATHWKAKAPPDRGGLPLSTERPHPGQEALGPQDPNPGLPPTLHLRTVQGMMRERIRMLRPSRMYSSRGAPASDAGPSGAFPRSHPRELPRKPAAAS